MRFFFGFHEKKGKLGEKQFYHRNLFLGKLVHMDDKNLKS